MLKSLILGLVLLLITLSAAQLGQDQQLKTVLRTAKTPKPSFSSSQPTVQEDTSSSSESSASEPLRFVPDKQIPKSTGRLTIVDPDGESSMDSSADSASQSVDPSAAAQADPDAEHSQMQPTVATKEQAQAAAEPYIKELFSLRSKTYETLEKMEAQIMDKLSQTPANQQQAVAVSLAGEYVPKINQLIAQTDTQAYKTITTMTAVLASVGANDAIAKEAKDTYEKEKTEKMAYYTSLAQRLLQQFSSSSSPQPQEEGSGL